MDYKKSIWVAGIFIFQLGYSEAHAATKEVSKDVTVQPLVRTHQLCGATFQSLEAISSSPEIEVQYVSMPMGKTEYRITIPSITKWASSEKEGPKVATNISVKSPAGVSSSVMLLPDVPIFSLDEKNPNRLCEWIKDYQNAYAKQKTINLNTDLFSLSVSNNKIGISTKKGMISLPVLPKSLNSFAPMKKDGNSVPDYLVITQDLYRPEADELANYRATQGYTPLVINVTQLPGYQNNDSTPTECTGPYQYECYLTESSFTRNVGRSAVSSLLGMKRTGSVSQPSSRIIYTGGLIRAYIRRMKTSNPNLKAVLLIGDPEVIPSSAYAAGSPNDTTLHLGTDVYYMEPFVALNPNNTFHPATMGPINLTEFTCWSGEGTTITYRPWCLPGEFRKEWTENRFAINYPVKLGTSSIPYSNGTFPLASIDQWVPVGRIITQSSLKPNGHDDSVQNYVTKLKYWESHLPSKYGNSFYTGGGNEKWLYSYQDFTNLFANYGANSKIYMSNDYLTPGTNSYDPNLSAACPTCTYKSADEILQEASLTTHTAWGIVGHGGHFGMQGTQNFLDSTKKNFFAVGKQHFSDFNGYNGVKGALTTTDQGTQNALLELLGTGNKLIGHVFANSCDVASYYLFQKDFQKQMKTLDPELNQSSFAEALIGMPNGGAINTYLNNNVGWSSSDNTHNRNFANAVHTAWSNCGRIGDSLIILLTNNSDNNRFAFHNRVFMGDPLAKIAAPPAHCLKDSVYTTPEVIKNEK